MNNPAITEYSGDTARATLPEMQTAERLTGECRTAGRQQFDSWLKYSCKACFDQVWLDYQQKKASRYTPALKITYKVVAAADHLPLRYMITLIYQKAAPIKPFRSRKGHCADEVERLHQTWLKATCWPVVLEGGPHGKVS